jgi:hypothetical protein
MLHKKPSGSGTSRNPLRTHDSPLAFLEFAVALNFFMNAVIIAMLWTLSTKLTSNCSTTPSSVNINRVYINQGN